MTDLDRRALAPLNESAARPLAAATGLALAASIAFLIRHIAPGAPAIFPLGLAALAGLSVAALAFTLDDEAQPGVTLAALAGAGLALAGAFVDAETRLALFGFASVALGVGLALWLLCAAERRPRVRLASAALYAVILAALSAYGAYFVLASRDLMIADFMTYRRISVMVARLAEAGDWPLLVPAAIQSIPQDYSWAPALAPGLLMALTAPFSRAVYTFAILSLYAAPALFALSLLARDLARGATSVIADPSCRAAAFPRKGVRLVALGAAAAFAVYPAGMAVAARGMPDVGGLALVICALRLADRLARLLSLPKGQEARVARLIRRAALALALALFAMFVFRRWYAFAAAGIIAALAVEVALVAFRRGANFRWKSAAATAALGVLVLPALMSPVIVDWLPNLSAHDYGSAYAAYRKPPGVFLRELADWVGLMPALAALASAAFLWARSRDRRLLRLTLGSAGVAAALFLTIQTPYAHHLYLIAPALTAPVAAALMLIFSRAPRRALAALAGLAALTFSPLAAALTPFGLAPIAGLPHAPRTDLAELERLKDWVDAHARPETKVCGLGSSYTFSSELIADLWQLQPERMAIERRPRTDVAMPDVDTVDGPPPATLKDCAFIIVGDPAQTHLDPAYQKTVIIPSREMLTGQGIGAKFRRTGGIFHLERGVNAVVFERTVPLNDSDIAALQARWRAARATLGFSDASR